MGRWSAIFRGSSVWRWNVTFTFLVLCGENRTSFFVAGVVCGEVGRSLFVAGVVCGEVGA